MCFSERAQPAPAQMLPTMPPFDFETDDSGNIGKWKNWIRGFEIFAKACKIEDNDEKLNWMLHCAGQKVQNIFHTLPDIDAEEKRGPLASGFVPFDTNPYNEAILKLNNFFEPKRNTSFERHVFRKMKHNDKERIDAFIVRLREQAERCSFDDQLEGNIKDQVTSGCKSNLLRRKILERNEWKLENILNHARILEAVEQQQKSFDSENDKAFANKPPLVDPSTEVCKIDAKPKFNEYRRSQTSFEPKFNGICGRCGYKGHKANDDKCPAKGKECAKCGALDHFARKCFSRFKKNETTLKRKTDDNGSTTEIKREKREPINLISQVHVTNTNTSDDEDVLRNWPLATNRLTTNYGAKLVTLKLKW